MKSPPCASPFPMSQRPSNFAPIQARPQHLHVHDLGAFNRLGNTCKENKVLLKQRKTFGAVFVEMLRMQLFFLCWPCC